MGPSPEHSRQWMLCTKLLGHTSSCPCSHGSPCRSWWNSHSEGNKLVVQPQKDRARGGSLEPVGDVGSARGWFLPEILWFAPPETRGICVMSVSLGLSFTGQLWQSAGLDPMEQLLKEGKEIMGACEGQAKRLVPTSDSFSCSSLQLLTCQTQFMFLSVYFTILGLFEGLFSFQCKCCCHSLSPRSLLISPVWAGCPAGSAVPLTLPGSATCPVLSLQSSLGGRGESWITAPARPLHQHSTHRSAICRVTEPSRSGLCPKLPKPGSLDRCQNPWGNFLPQEFHQQTTPLQFPWDQCLSGKSPPLFTPWLAYRCIIYNLTDLTLLTSCSMKQPPILLKAFRFLIQKKNAEHVSAKMRMTFPIWIQVIAWGEEPLTSVGFPWS